MKGERTVGRYSFPVSNQEKVFFPGIELCKGDLIDYYTRIADWMLPHVRGRIVTMQRYPDGIEGGSFYQKNVPDYFPDWIRTVEVKKEGGSLRQLAIENAATLAYLANQGCITIHVWLSRADRIDRPDRLILDLDPSTEDFGAVRAAARAARELFDDLGLRAFVMTTGSKGLHVLAPLDRRADFDEVRDVAARMARRLCARDPKRLTVEQRKNKRGDRVFVDYLRNAYGQHGVAPYSVRPLPGAPVATPIDWDELGDRRMHPQRYTVQNLFRRLSRKDDPWSGIGRQAGSLKRARRRLESLEKAEDDQ